MVAQKVPYKLPNDIPLKLSTLHVVNRQFIFHQNTRMAIAGTPDAKKKKKSSVNSHINTYLCQFMAQNSKIWGSKKLLNFLTSQKLAPFGPANGQSVTYSEIQTKVCRTPYSTPMDRFLIKSVNPEYPLSCHKCVEKQTFCILCPARPPECVTPPQKWYHYIA